MSYAFNGMIAEKIGLPAAVILEGIKIFVQAHANEEEHIHDGRIWIYNSFADWRRVYPFLSKNTIERAIQKLKDEEYILTGCYNKKTWDRTVWYTLTDKASEELATDYAVSSRAKTTYPQNGEMHFPKTRNAERRGSEEPPIPKMGKGYPQNGDDNTCISSNISSSLSSKDDSVSADKPADRRPPSVPYEKIKDAYNAICGASLPKVKTLSPKRKKLLKARWEDVGGSMDEMEAVFRKVQESNFLSGRDGKWPGCDFDWILNQEKFIRIQEGSYDNRASAQKGANHGASGQHSQQNPYGEQYQDFVEWEKRQRSTPRSWDKPGPWDLPIDDGGNGAASGADNGDRGGAGGLPPL